MTKQTKQCIHSKPKSSTQGKGSLLSEIRRGIAAGLFALLIVLLPASLAAAPIVVAINDVPNGAPVIQVFGAPQGYNLYTGEQVADPAIEDGALVTLTGVNNAFTDPAPLPDWSGRFLIPSAPNPNRRGVDIVWVEHDFDLVGSGDLRIGFNSAFPGVYYANPNPFNGAEDLGLVTDLWVQVYTSDIVVIFFNPHTYRLRN